MNTSPKDNYTYNLIYNLCITFINPILYFNISNLKRFILNFNGKKIINVTYDKDIDFAVNFIKENFSEYDDIQFIYTQNHPELHETVPFINELLPRVFSTNENEFTFYGHSKGVSRYKHEIEALCLLWIYTLYQENLKNFNLISQVLNKYSCCGCLRINKPYTALSFVSWHFSGTFFWFNNNKLFSKQNWQTIFGSRYGVEGYLGTHFNLEESYCLAYNIPEGKENIMDTNNWEIFYKG